MNLGLRIGPLHFTLASVEHRLLRLPAASPFTRLADGTEVVSILQGDARYLVVDHRRNPDTLARVELWKTTETAELPIAGLYAVCDALNPNETQTASIGPSFRSSR